jgi:hypothetical protein
MDSGDFFNPPFEFDGGNYQAQPTLGSAPDQDSKNYITDVFSGMPTIPETTYGHFQSASYAGMGPPSVYDWLSSHTESVPPHSKAIPIIKRTARHPSISGCSRSPHARGDSMTFSPSSKISSSLMGDSYTTTATMDAGFSQEQLPAAQAILQFIADRPHEPIPSHLINDQLAEIRNGHGY